MGCSETPAGGSHPCHQSPKEVSNRAGRALQRNLNRSGPQGSSCALLPSTNHDKSARVQGVITSRRGDEPRGDAGMAEGVRGDGASGHEKLEAMWDVGETVE